MKILNLYSGLGGNRKLWAGHDVTAIEYNHEIAKAYKSLYPEDNVIVADAHQYLLDHVLDGWDFIWASPPCPSHSRINFDGRPPRYPEMSLYEEIIMLGNWFKGLWCVENVKPYYAPLVEPTIELDRHLFWSNFKVSKIDLEPEKPIKFQKGSGERFGINLLGVDIKHDKRQILRNLVNPEIGEHILNCAQGIEKPKEQLNLF